MELRFVDAKSVDYKRLADALDAYYYTLVGDVQDRYKDVNRPENMNCLIVAYEGDSAVACGAWKRVDEKTAEVKRIYVLPEFRRRGIASAIIRKLEAHIQEHGYCQILLETARTTGDSQALYLSLGYTEIPYYGSPAGAENCRCFLKEI